MSRLIFIPLVLLAVAAAASIAGCSSADRINPSFPLTVADADEALHTMRDDPQPFDRPVLIIGGWANTRMMTARLAGSFRSIGADDVQVEHVSLLTATSFERCRERVIQAVDRAFGEGDDTTDDSGETVEVDVIGFSMGGLVARYAAAPRTDGKRRLSIRRLFTIATPHQGADMAVLAAFERRASDMRRGSALLALLNEHCPPPDYEIISYARLDDLIVGAANCCPMQGDLWWVPNRPFEGAHSDAFRDARIIADIGRRLRGETPFTRSPASPLPGLESPGSALSGQQRDSPSRIESDLGKQ